MTSELVPGASGGRPAGRRGDDRLEAPVAATDRRCPTSSLTDERRRRQLSAVCLTVRPSAHPSSNGVDKGARWAGTIFS